MQKLRKNRINTTIYAIKEKIITREIYKRIVQKT
jgi:hypothetical protein